jgi:hypothetical protein
MPIALRQGKVKVRLPSPPSPVTPDHPVPVVVNPDASHSFAAPDNDGHAAHGQRDHGGSPDSAVRPRAAPRAGRWGHSRRHNRSGRDRSSCRPVPERGNERTETGGPNAPTPAPAGMDDIRKEWNTAPAFVPSTVWARRRSATWQLRSAPCRPRQIRRFLSFAENNLQRAFRRARGACGYVDNARALPTYPQATTATARNSKIENRIAPAHRQTTTP